MNVKHFVVAAAVLVSTTGAFAADTTAATAAADSSVAGATATATATAAKLNLPRLDAPSSAPRAEVKTEAAETVKNYKTALALQLDQYRN